MGRHGGRTKKKGQMGRGRALERQESDGEKAARGGCLPLSTLNEGEREERRRVRYSSQAQKFLPLISRKGQITNNAVQEKSVR